MREALRGIAQALFVFVYYQFIALPLVREYAAVGLLLAGALAAGLLLSLPPGTRRGTAGLALAFLLALRGFDTLKPETAALQAGGTLILLAVYPALAYLSARTEPRRALAAVGLAGLIAFGTDVSLAPLWAHFLPRWTSPRLTDQPRLPFFAHLVEDVDGDGRAEVIVPGRAEWQPKQRELPLPEVYLSYRVYRWAGGGMREVPLDPAATARLWDLTRNDFIATPPYAHQWARLPGAVPAFTYRFVRDPFTTAALAGEAGQLPFTALGLTLAASDRSFTERDGLARRSGALGLAPRPATAFPAPRGDRLVAGEADVDGDGQPEQLTLFPDRGAAIMRPGEGEGGILWQAPNDSFRFETAGRLGAGGQETVIAYDKGFLGLDPMRYLGGYRLDKDGRLAREWKVFAPGLVNPSLGDVDGDGRNELVVALYGKQQVMVLAPHGLPVVPAAYLLTLFVLLWNVARRRAPAGHPLSRPGLAAAAGMLAVAAVLAPGLPTPARTLSTGAVPEPVDAGGRPLPGARQTLADAVKRTRAEARWNFQGETLTYMGKRRAQLTYTGMGEAGRAVRAQFSLLGDTFGLYRQGRFVYLYDGKRWWRRTQDDLRPPASPGDLLDWLPSLAEGARLLPRTEIISRARCRIVALSPRPGQILAHLPEKLLAPGAPGRARAELGTYKLLVWIGNKDGLIYQVQLVSHLPAPEVGVLLQKSMVRFWGYDDPAVKAQAPRGLPQVDAYPAPGFVPLPEGPGDEPAPAFARAGSMADSMRDRRSSHELARAAASMSSAR